MVVMTPRQTWTDERLDEFKASVNQRFDEVDRRFDQIDKRLDRMDEDIRELRVAVNGVQRVMSQGFIGICTVMIAGFTALSGILG
jgi:hypothetical protein